MLKTQRFKRKSKNTMFRILQDNLIIEIHKRNNSVKNIFMVLSLYPCVTPQCLSFPSHWGEFSSPKCERTLSHFPLLCRTIIHSPSQDTEKLSECRLEVWSSWACAMKMDSASTASQSQNMEFF